MTKIKKNTRGARQIFQRHFSPKIDSENDLVDGKLAAKWLHFCVPAASAIKHGKMPVEQDYQTIRVFPSPLLCRRYAPCFRCCSVAVFSVWQQQQKRAVQSLLTARRSPDLSKGCWPITGLALIAWTWTTRTLNAYGHVESLPWIPLPRRIRSLFLAKSRYVESTLNVFTPGKNLTKMTYW